MATFEQRHYEVVAGILAGLRANAKTCKAFADAFAADNPRFKRDLFMDASATYRIKRFYLDNEHPDNGRVVKTGLSLREAREYCKRADTHKTGVWFDGYEPLDEHRRRLV